MRERREGGGVADGGAPSFPVTTEFREPRRYASICAEVRADEIDGFVRSALRDLRARYSASGPPFSLYKGCDKDDAQLVEVCLPTPHGPNTLEGSNVAYTVARGRQCDYPEILRAYDAVARHLAANGLEASGPPREVYLTDVGADGEPEMQIVFPIAANSRAATGAAEGVMAP